MVAHGVRLIDGHLRVVRVAPPEDPEELRRVGDALRAAAGAGAVEVVDLLDDGSRVELVLAYAGRPVSAPLPATDVAKLGATLARSLATLHERGRWHGALRADHVLVDAQGAVRLCGFSTDGDAASDVQQLGTLLLSLLDDREHGTTVETVRAAAARCLVGDVEARPSMSAVAVGLAASSVPARADDAETPRRRRLSLVAAGVLGVALAITVVAQRPQRGSVRVPPAAVTGATATTSTSTPPATTTHAAERVWPRPISEFEGEGSSWRIATSPGDHVVLGDWDCDHVRTPAIVRTTGDVFVVDAFPSGDAVAARYVTTIPDAVGASIESRDGCDHLTIATPSGRLSVRLRPARAA